MKLIISQKAENARRALCKQIPTDEWIGMCFYELVSGSILNKDATFKLVDIYPIYKTTGMYFKFEPGAEYISYLINNGMTLELKHGMIHSHCSSGVSPSGTDDSDLKDQTKSFNVYLSVITNNTSCWSARLGIKVKSEIELKGFEYTYDVNNQPIKREVIDKHEAEDIVFEKLEIVYEEYVNSDYYAIIDNIVKEHAERTKKKKAAYTPPTIGYRGPNYPPTWNKKPAVKSSAFPTKSYNERDWFDDVEDNWRGPAVQENIIDLYKVFICDVDVDNTQFGNHILKLEWSEDFSLERFGMLYDFELAELNQLLSFMKDFECNFSTKFIKDYNNFLKIIA